MKYFLCSHIYKFDRFYHIGIDFNNGKSFFGRTSIYKCIKCGYENWHKAKPVEDLND